MKIVRLPIPDVVLIEPRVFADERGFFFESFQRRRFEEAVGRQVDFVQDNHSRSRRKVLRGLHYQLRRPQGKLVRVVHGRIFDLAVDLRRSSPTYLQWVSAILTETNRKQMWIPPGFAHGFLVLSESADVLYKTTDTYCPDDERVIAWNDPALRIAWPRAGLPPLLSDRDRMAPTLDSAELP